MNITEVRVTLAGEPPAPRTTPGGWCVAYASVVLDNCFVVHDMKVVSLPGGKLLLSMPSAKREDHCPQCQKKNPLQAKFCNSCGHRLPAGRVFMSKDKDGGDRPSWYRDLAHPIDNSFRQLLTQKVLYAYEAERSMFTGEDVA